MLSASTSASAQQIYQQLLTTGQPQWDTPDQGHQLITRLSYQLYQPDVQRQLNNLFPDLMPQALMDKFLDQCAQELVDLTGTTVDHMCASLLYWRHHYRSIEYLTMLANRQTQPQSALRALLNKRELHSIQGFYHLTIKMLTLLSQDVCRPSPNFVDIIHLTHAVPMIRFLDVETTQSRLVCRQVSAKQVTTVAITWEQQLGWVIGNRQQQSTDDAYAYHYTAKAWAQLTPLNCQMPWPTQLSTDSRLTLTQQVRIAEYFLRIHTFAKINGQLVIEDLRDLLDRQDRQDRQDRRQITDLIVRWPTLNTNYNQYDLTCGQITGVSLPLMKRLEDCLAPKQRIQFLQARAKLFYLR